MTAGPSSSAPVVVTSGEPAGIGPDLCLTLADKDWPCRLVVAADPEVLEARARTLGRTLSLEVVRPDEARPHRRGHLQVLAHKARNTVVPGRLDPANAAYVLDMLTAAARGCQTGAFSAMVTAPVQKSVISQSGIAFSGHTEFLADLTGSKHPVMLLVAERLRVALATTHLPLRQVPDALSSEGLLETLRVLATGLRERFAIVDPKITVLGLNPHAGEAGHLGTEEIEVIGPAVAAARAEGIHATGPVPADTAFTPRQLTGSDAVLAMYHDQGLPVLKYAGFGLGVNITLGIPILRTSVDHGTALDLAGSGQADAGSLEAALRLALGCLGR